MECDEPNNSAVRHVTGQQFPSNPFQFFSINPLPAINFAPPQPAPSTSQPAPIRFRDCYPNQGVNPNNNLMPTRLALYKSGSGVDVELMRKNARERCLKQMRESRGTLMDKIRNIHLTGEDMEDDDDGQFDTPTSLPSSQQPYFRAPSQEEVISHSINAEIHKLLSTGVQLSQEETSKLATKIRKDLEDDITWSLDDDVTSANAQNEAMCCALIEGNVPCVYCRKSVMVLRLIDGWGLPDRSLYCERCGFQLPLPERYGTSLAPLVEDMLSVDRAHRDLCDCHVAINLLSNTISMSCMSCKFNQRVW